MYQISTLNLLLFTLKLNLFNGWINYIQNKQMLQNKFIKTFYRDNKAFFVVLFGLSIIALTVRAVSFR